MKSKIVLTILAVTLFQTAWSQKNTTIKIMNGDNQDKVITGDTIINPSPTHRHADTVKIGSITIIQCDNCSEDDNNTANTTTVHFGSYDEEDEKTPGNVDISWAVFDLGINNYIDKSNYGSPEVNNFVRLGEGNPKATEELFSLRTIKSVNVNIWPILVKVNLVKHVLNLKTGIGIVMNNYRYTKNITYVNTLDETYIKLSDIDLEKNKLFTEYLTIPVLLHLNSNPYRDSRAFHLSAGPTFGLLVKSRTKQKSDEKKKVKNNDPFNLEKFRVGLRGEIGYGPVNFYGAYSFTPIHKYGLEQYPFSIGISLGF